MFDFLSLQKEVHGLEITDAYVKMMRLARRGGRLVVISAGCLPLKRGLIEDGAIKNEPELILAIKKLAAQSAGRGSGKRWVAVSLPENKAFFKVITMPRLSQKEMKSAVIFESENHIPLSLDKVYLDFEEISSESFSENHCQVAVAALSKELVDSYDRVCDAAGLSPVAMELESQSAARAAKQSFIPHRNVALIKIGDTQSSAIFISRGSVRAVFSMPISNGYFIEKIAQELSVDFSEAEKLKVDYGIVDFERRAGSPNVGNNEQKRKIFEALLPGLVDFTQQIQKYISYYQYRAESGAADEIVLDKVIVCGAGANLKGIDDFLAIKLEVPVERLVLPIGIDINHFKNSEFLKNGANGCAVVAGLAMRAQEIEAQSKS